MKQIFSQIAQGDQGVLGRAEALHESLQATKLDVLQGAVDGAIQDRADNFMAAVQCYRDHPFRRQLNEPPVVWQEGSTRLLDYDWEKDRCGPGRQGAKQPIAKQPILVVPSLINRSYILDLLPDQSFLRWLAKQGFRPLLVDWDAPGPAEKGFELTDYVAGRLEACLNFVRADQERGPHSSATRKPVVLGYCMGGLLALALAQRRPEDLAGAVFLATPWDFHADGPDRARLLAASLVPLAPLMEAAGELPVDTIQALFSCLDPLQTLRKFLAFSCLDPQSPKAESFVALEDWLNDGVALTLPVARECLGRWYGDNSPALGAWRIAGQVVNPGAMTLPALCIIPDRDRIVPPESALALAHALPNCQTHRPMAGHIGMIASKKAPRTVWPLVKDWISTL